MVWWLTALIQLGTYVGITIISALLDRRDAPENAPGEPSFPKADPQAPIPVVYGTTRVGMNVTYKAGLTRGENTVRNGALSFGWSSTKIGTFYYLDLEAVICHGPVNHLHDVVVDGTKSLFDIGAQVRTPFESLGSGISYTSAPAFNGPTYFGNVAHETTEITITAGDLLGGKLSRGGIGAGGDAGSTGLMRFHPGGSFIEPNTRLETLYGGPLPNYPNICRVVFEDNFYFGNSESLPAVEFVISRRAPGVPFGGTGFIGNVTANAGVDAIAACVLWDLLTNTTYGLGLPPEELDESSFSYLATADAAVSFTLTEQTTGKAVISDLLRTLDGVLYTDPETGLLCVRLLRAPDAAYYGTGVVGSGITLDASNIRAIGWTDSAADVQCNEVKVEFIDRARRYTRNSVTVRNVAAIQALGRVESRTVSFLGCVTADMANSLGTRELRSRSAVLGHATITTDRTGYKFTPAQTFTLNYDIAGASSRTMRVVSVKDTPAGDVIVEAVEDVFSSPTPSFAVEETAEPATTPDYPTLAPYGYLDASVTGTTTGTTILYLYDPSAAVTLVEYRTQSGTAVFSSWTADTYPYSASVALDPYATSKIEWRVTYDDATGDSQTLTFAYTFGVDSDTAAETADNIAAGAAQLAVPVGSVYDVSAASIADASTELDVKHRVKRYLVGAGLGRVHVTVTAASGSGATCAWGYSTDDFGTAATPFAPVSIAATGQYDSGWVALPAAMAADVKLTPLTAGGGGTASATFSTYFEVLPGIITATRDHSDDFSDDFS